MTGISDYALYNLLSCLGLQQVNLAIEVLRGRVGLSRRNHESLVLLDDDDDDDCISDDDIVEAAAYAAFCDAFHPEGA